MSDILILGHTGFLGRALQETLKADGRSIEDLNLLYPSSTTILANLLPSYRVLVIGAAVVRWVKDDRLTMIENLQMMETVLQAIERSPVEHVLYLSSVAVYGEHRTALAITEHTPPHPSSSYGMGKLAAEHWMQTWADQHPKSVLTIIRPTTVYGVGAKVAQYLPSGFLWHALQGNQIVRWGDGSELRDFLYIEDFCRIMQQLIEHRVPGAFTVGCGRSLSYQHVLAMIEQHLGTPLQIEERPRTKVQVSLGYDLQSLRYTLGRIPHTPMEQAIPLMAQEWKDLT